VARKANRLSLPTVRQTTKQTQKSLLQATPASTIPSSSAIPTLKFLLAGIPHAGMHARHALGAAVAFTGIAVTKAKEKEANPAAKEKAQLFLFS
jgi:hypothetical protein